VLKKRLIGVITVKDGWGVQSFGYSRHLPLGLPEVLAENLDRWGADEILVLAIDRSRRGLGPDIGLVRRLGAMGLSTPLTYGGGIRSTADAGEVIRAGADRVSVDSVLRSDPEEVRAIAALFGAQAVVGVLPTSREDGVVCWLDHLTGTMAPIRTEQLALFHEQVISEALVVDWRGEGTTLGFDPTLIRDFPDGDIPIVAFGGISDADQMARILAHKQVVALAVGNFLAYQEHAVQRFKKVLTGRAFRSAEFAER
jgi:imidazole glycerol-phosphate synthase subunit HisF